MIHLSLEIADCGGYPCEVGSGEWSGIWRGRGRWLELHTRNDSAFRSPEVQRHCDHCAGQKAKMAVECWVLARVSVDAVFTNSLSGHAHETDETCIEWLPVVIDDSVRVGPGIPNWHQRRLRFVEKPECAFIGTNDCKDFAEQGLLAPGEGHVVKLKER